MQMIYHQSHQGTGSSHRLLASHRTWSRLQRCWSDKMFLPLLAHRLWRLTLQILARYSIFVKELPDLLETIKPKLEVMGFKNFSSISVKQTNTMKEGAPGPAGFA
ncbi:conserved oligomeric Golgi complex subunit 2-like isoform X2 [Muntiacus reevesi]|uniref:conserved oligomeric Golgi complex subunit 2-like isoform X2 n=1 Tax=Muntiacus reevesi TaxID=9886 RepID=UPI003306F820